MQNASADKMSREDRRAYIKSMKSSVERKTAELEEMQRSDVKFQLQQGLKEEIYRIKRNIAKHEAKL